MFLDKYINENGVSTDYPVFDNIYKDLFINTNDLFLAQYKDNQFNAIDIIIKYLAIEHYYGLNNYGFDLYNKLQYYRTGKNWENRFLNLIKSFENGYDNESFLDVDLNYSIHDGAHRVALALYHDIEQLKIRLFNTNLYRREYKYSYLLPYFTDNELIVVRQKFEELLNKTREPYYCILWPPTNKISKQIEQAIPNIEEGVRIINSQQINLDEKILKSFVYDVYRTDDIQKYKLDLKYNHMMNSLKNNSDISNPYPVNIMQIVIDNPDFRVKPITGLPQSKVTMRIKTNIRDKYQKFINDYYYDIMMHMTDNNHQNCDVKKLIKTVNKEI